jgi:deoxyribodipyrimidine photo-lyase
MILPDCLADDPRATRRNSRAIDRGGRVVLYWMQRAQRGFDNPALDAAIEAANALEKPLVVFLGIVPFYPNANERHYAFLLDGVAETARAIDERGATFVFRPYPEHDVLAFAREVRAALVVGDENPLREPERWRRLVAKRLSVPLVTIDADVVVPSSFFPKEEWAARTIRPKIHRALDRFLVAGREPRARFRLAAKDRPRSRSIEPAELLRELPLDRSARPIEGLRAGTTAGLAELDDFVTHRLRHYADRRNRPEHADGTSRLSPYLHFGHLGPRAVALSVKKARAPKRAKAAFLEELIVRRELAVNFVARNPDYDRYAGFPAWARRTLEEHRADERPTLYSKAELEGAATHDLLWNAAQVEMMTTGRMHGYVRMYWAKKILEWSASPAEALQTAIRLNDRYFLDGRDPNGYANIAWAIGGRHDRPWIPRPIFGTVRYMSEASTARKFDSRAYIARVRAAAEAAG